MKGTSATRVRVWTDELPEDAVLPTRLSLEKFFFDSLSESGNSKTVALELFRPNGPSFHYGLLGGKFEKSNRTFLEVLVPIEDPRSERPFPQPLSRSLDRVTVGGGSEFYPAIISAIKELDARTLPPGVLTITCMAHGAVGSVPAVFSSLARALVRMLTRNDQPHSFEEAMSLLAA